MTKLVPFLKGLEHENGEFYVIDPAMHKRSITNPNSKWKEFLNKHGIPQIGKKIKV